MDKWGHNASKCIVQNVPNQAKFNYQFVCVSAIVLSLVTWESHWQNGCFKRSYLVQLKLLEMSCNSSHLLVSKIKLAKMTYATYVTFDNKRYVYTVSCTFSFVGYIPGTFLRFHEGEKWILEKYENILCI